MKFLSSPKLKNSKGGTLMSKKITFLVLALIVAFSFSLMAEPAVRGPLGNVITNVSSSRAVGDAVYICDGGNYRTFAPGAAKQVQITPGGNVAIFLVRGTSSSSYYGGYFYYSNDFGGTWSQSPATGAVFAPESTYERMYSDIRLGSDALGYAPYVVANIRVGSAAANDSIVFSADLSGLGAGDWANSYVADNGDGAYRYLPTMELIGDSAIFVPMLDISDNSIWLNASYDYGTTWNQLNHFTAADFSSLVAATSNVDSVTGVDIGEIVYLPTSGRLVFITDAYANVHVDFNGTDSLLEGSAALAYYTSDDFGATWSAPDWVIPTAVPDGFGDWPAAYAWKSWQAVLTSDEKIALVTEQYAPGMGWGAVFASIYDGTSWTSTQIMTPETPDENYGIWAKWSSQNLEVTVDNSGNAYAIWPDITDTTIVNDTVYQHIRLAGAKYDGSVWHTAEIIDTTELADFFDFGAAAHLDDNGNIPIVMQLNADSIYYFTVPAPLGIATKNLNTVKTMNLAQNMPNPVRGNTTINYSVAKSGHVTLNVYDMSGKLVKTLVNGNVNAGTHSVVWNRTDNRNNKVAGGVYFYKMNANNETLTKKMIVVK